MRFFLHLRGSITLTDMAGLELSDARKAAEVAMQMLRTYQARPGIDVSDIYVEIVDEAGRLLSRVDARGGAG
jgi:hypothetical protein